MVRSAPNGLRSVYGRSWAIVVLLASCTGDFSVGSDDASVDGAAPPDRGADALGPDRGAADLGGPIDMGGADGPPADTGGADGPPADTGTVDANAPDVVTPVDMRVIDMRAVDIGSTDMGVDDAGPADTALPDLGDMGTASTCEPVRLRCLDPADPRVIELPLEMDQLDDVTGGDTIQVRAARVGFFRVPPFVTFRGCEGASLTGNLLLEGDAVVEGFDTTDTAAIAANRTGEVIIRDNRIAGTDEGAVLVESRDAFIGHRVIATVERNVFTGGRTGIVASTRFDNAVRTVDITVRNNLFIGVERPVVLSETGLMADITADLAFNTYVDFDTAVQVFGMDRPPTIRTSVFAEGTLCAFSNVNYRAPQNVFWNVEDDASRPPIDGAFTRITPAFVGAGDYRLLASPAIDAVRADFPFEDVFNCPRPLGAGADLGALESR